MKSRLRPDKRGIELSVNFIIILIITIVLFAFSLYLLGLIGSGVQQVGESLDRQTADRIEALIKQENALVAIPFNVRQVQLGDPAIIGVGVKNIEGDDAFGLVVRFDGAYYPDGRPILNADPTYIDQAWVGTSSLYEPTPILHNEYQAIGFPLIADDKLSQSSVTEPGDYVFNVCVFRESKGQPSCIVDSISTEADILYPPGKIYQVTLRVK